MRKERDRLDEVDADFGRKFFPDSYHSPTLGHLIAIRCLFDGKSIPAEIENFVMRKTLRKRREMTTFIKNWNNLVESRPGRAAPSVYQREFRETIAFSYGLGISGHTQRRLDEIERALSEGEGALDELMRYIYAQDPQEGDFPFRPAEKRNQENFLNYLNKYGLEKLFKLQKT